MTTMTIAEVQATLPELLGRLVPGEEVVITNGHDPVATLIPRKQKRQPRLAGNCKGVVTVVSDDNEYLEDFQDYR